MSCPVKPNWFLFAQKLIFELSLTYSVCTTLAKITAFVSSPKVSVCLDQPQLSLHKLWIQPVQVIKEPALCFSFCLGVTRDKAHDYYTHCLTSTWLERPAKAHEESNDAAEPLVGALQRNVVISALGRSLWALPAMAPQTHTLQGQG